MKHSDEIKHLIPDDTLCLSATTDSSGKITSIESIPIKEASDLNEIGANIIMNTVLTKSYGIDIVELASDFVESTQNALILLSPVLKACDWDNATIKDNSVSPSVTVPVLDYISNKFKIYNSDIFIDTIYEKLRNAVVSMQYDYRNNYCHVYLDGETNLMINVLAVVIGSNDTFMDIKIGEDQLINIPIDLENFNNTMTFLGNYLVDKGYVDESLRDNFTIGGFYEYLLNPVTGATGSAWDNNIGFNNNGEFKYVHLFVNKIARSDSTRWQPLIIVTKKQIKGDVQFDSSTVSYKSNSVPAYYPHLIDKATNQENMNKEYLAFSSRDMGRYPGSLVYCVDYPMETTSQIWSDGQLLYGCDATYNVYVYASDIGGAGGSVNRLELTSYIKFPVAPNGLIDYEVSTYGLNNQLIEESASLHQPTIDQITAQNLEDNNISLICTGREGLDIYLTLTNVSSVLKPSVMPFDTSSDLKIAAVDPILNVLLNDPNTTTTDFEHTNRADWRALWLTNITLKYNSHLPLNVGMGTVYGLTPELLQDFSKMLWLAEGSNPFDALWDTIEHWGLKNPMDFLVSLKRLPYNLIPNVDYKTVKQGTTDLTYFNYDSTVPLRIGSISPEKSTAANPQPRGYQLISPVHEITFLLKGDNKVRLHDNFTDYEPYVKTMIYLPFVGDREINPAFVMKQDLMVKYRISNITGDFIVTVSSFNEFINDYNTNGAIPPSEQTYTEGAPILKESGNLAVECLLSSQNADVKGVINGITKTISSCLGSYTKSSQSMGSSGINKSSTSNRFNTSSSTNTTGTGLSHTYTSNIGNTKGDYINNFSNDMASKMSQLSSAVDFGGVFSGVVDTGMSLLSGGPVNVNGVSGEDAAWLMVRVPYITLSYNPPIEDMIYYSAFDKTIGQTTQRGLQIKDMTPDYHEIQSVKLEGINCTNQERQMIYNILMAGFYNGKSLKAHSHLNLDE